MSLSGERPTAYTTGAMAQFRPFLRHLAAQPFGLADGIEDETQALALVQLDGIRY